MRPIIDEDLRRPLRVAAAVRGEKLTRYINRTLREAVDRDIAAGAVDFKRERALGGTVAASAEG